MGSRKLKKGVFGIMGFGRDSDYCAYRPGSLGFSWFKAKQACAMLTILICYFLVSNQFTIHKRLTHYLNAAKPIKACKNLVSGATKD